MVWKILPVPTSYSTGPTFCCSDLGHFGRVPNGPTGLESWRYISCSLHFMYWFSGQRIPIVILDMPSIIWEFIPSRDIGSWLIQALSPFCSKSETPISNFGPTNGYSSVWHWVIRHCLAIGQPKAKNKQQLREMSPLVFRMNPPKRLVRTLCQ